MTNYEKLALRVLGQKEMLYKLQSKLTKRFMQLSLPIKQNELHNFIIELLQEIKQLDNKFNVRLHLKNKDLMEYNSFDYLFEHYKINYKQAHEIEQQSFDFGELIENDRT